MCMHCHFKDYFHIFVLFFFKIEIPLLSSSRKVIRSKLNGIYLEIFCCFSFIKRLNNFFLTGHIIILVKETVYYLNNCFIIFTHYIPAFYKQPWRRRCPRNHHKQILLWVLVSQLHALLSVLTLQPNVRRLFQLKIYI